MDYARQNTLLTSGDPYAVNILLTPPSPGTPVTVRGPFRSGAKPVDAFGNRIEQIETAVVVNLDDCPTLARTWTVTVAGQAYTIREIEKDGLGIAELFLVKAA